MLLKQMFGPSKLGKWGRPVLVSGFTSDHHLNYDIIRTLHVWINTAVLQPGTA